MESFDRKLDNFFKDIPEALEPKTTMSKPNEPVFVYEGSIEISNGNQYNSQGRFDFFWFPHNDIRWQGATDLSKDLASDFQTQIRYKIFLENKFVGNFLFTKLHSNNLSGTQIGGKIDGTFFLGDKSVPVEYIRFEIPNLTPSFLGESIKRGKSLSKARIILEDDTYLLVLDQIQDFNKKKEMLQSEGGFLLLYTAHLSKKKNSINFDEAEKYLKRLYYFLSFVNGLRVSPLFIKGFVSEAICWQDFSHYTTDQYKGVWSWCPRHDISKLNELWKNFSSLSKSPSDYDCLTTAIHWYVEANKVAGFVEGSIMMVQNALELLYNWITVERKQIIRGEDSKSLGASNKIRLLLSQMNINFDMPLSLTSLHTFANKMDGPEALVQIRNAIVHSQEEKRKKLNALTPSTLSQALHLGLWYVEMILLHTLSYTGKYHNRCLKNNFRVEIAVPWVEKTLED